jgi:hypothetical protein
VVPAGGTGKGQQGGGGEQGEDQVVEFRREGGEIRRHCFALFFSLVLVWRTLLLGGKGAWVRVCVGACVNMVR